MKIKTLFFLLLAKALFAVDIEGIALIYPDKEEPYCVPEALEERLAPFLGTPLELSALEKIKGEIAAFYTELGHPFIAVCIPEQKVEKGVVQVHLIEPKIDSIKYKGNHWFSKEAVAEALNLKRGDPLREASLLQKLTWINRNPFLRTSAVISPGETKGTSALEIATKDRFPFRFYNGVDNTGTDVTGIYRYFLGMNWAIHLRSTLSYQYTAALDFHKFWSHFGSWTLYLPWGHQLVFYGAYAKIHPKIDTFRSIGRSTQLSGRYSFFRRPLSQSFRSEFHFGYDYKQFNSALFFIEHEGETFSSLVSSKNASVSQFVIGYDSAISSKKNQFSFSWEATFSPCRMLPNQTKLNYNLLREGAQREYIYGRIYLSNLHQLPYRFGLNTILQTQISGMILLPSEQFGIGGHNTVRGYEEREYLADNAFCGTLEIHLPSYSFSPKTADELFFLAFTDYGYGSTLRQFLTEKSSRSFWSFGGGVRYAILPYFTARLDYGYRMIASEQSTAGGGRFHFSVTGSF